MIPELVVAKLIERLAKASWSCSTNGAWASVEGVGYSSAPGYVLKQKNSQSSLV